MIHIHKITLCSSKIKIFNLLILQSPLNLTPSFKVLHSPQANAKNSDGWVGGLFPSKERVDPENTPLSSQMLLVLISYILLCKLFFLFRAFHINWIFQICYYRNIYWRKIVLQSYFQLYKDVISAWYIMHHPWVPLLFIADKCEQDTQLISTHPHHVWWCCLRAPGPASSSVFLGSYTTAAHACPVIYIPKYQCVYYTLFSLRPSLVAQQ